MDGFFRYYPWTLDAAVGLATVLAVAAALAGIGALVGGRRRLQAADFVVGWGAACLASTALGIGGMVPLTAVAMGLGAAGIAGLALAARRDGRIGAAGAGKILLLALPLFAVLAGMTPSQWDEFSHWLPNGLYLIDHDAFPGPGLPSSESVYPAYPYGVPLLTYLASRAAGRLVENAGALFNTVGLLSFGLLLLSVIRRAREQPAGSGEAPRGSWGCPPNPRVSPARAPGAPGWGLVACTLLAVTVFNPTFVPKLVFTAYADFPTALGVGFAGVLGWFVLDALSRGSDEEGRERARAYAIQMGLALAFAVNAKQANFVLFALVFGALLVAAWRDANVGLPRVAPFLAWIATPPLVVYGLWEVHVAWHLPDKAMAFLPLSQWNIGLIPEILRGMATVALKKGAYFGLMAVATVLAARALQRVRGPLDRLSIMAGTVFVGYSLFLLFIYVSAYDAQSARTVGWYWRFNTHLGLLGVAFAVYGAALLWTRHLAPRAGWRTTTVIGRAAIAAVVVLPLAAAPKLRFDVHPVKDYVRAVADDLLRLLPKTATLVIVDPLDTDLYMLMVRHRLGGTVRVVGHVTVHAPDPAARLEKLLDGARPSHLWVHTETKEVSQVLGLELAPRASSLVERRSLRWTVVKSWPYPGYERPADVPD